jgi:aminopeptidase N
MKFEQSDEELAFIMAHDTDSFNRWDAGKQHHPVYVYMA